MRRFLPFLLLFFILACADLSVLECEQGYMFNGTVCCQDKDNNSICDLAHVLDENAEAPPAVKPIEIQQPIAPVVIKQPIDSTERQALIEAFAKNTVSLWQRQRWRELHQILPLEDKVEISEQEFNILMPLFNYDNRVEHDPSYEYIKMNPKFNQFKGLVLTLGEVTLDGDTASATVEVMFGNRPTGEQDLSFVWDNQWFVKNPLPTNEKEDFCDTSGYAHYCYAELAKAYKKPEYCAKSGMYFIECYQGLSREIPVDVAVAVCGAQDTRTLNDACLNNVAFETRSALLCDEIAIKLNWYECLGIIAGYAGNFQQCTGVIEGINKLTETRYENRCAYGYARATGDNKICDLIDNDLEPELRDACGDVTTPERR
ncbi:hypothetical protein GOV07_03880 [Candidatus Woesearchaeota archaeon]|nr:hypothetical protein [Candidatus Woesearchaeota archaeon]